jgi:CubicO group peptidase (beta-lactamase class C family)
VKPAVTNIRIAAFGLLVTIAVVGNAGARGPDASLRAAYPANGPGAFAVAAVGGTIAFAKGYGKANIELHAPFTLDSVVRIASLTKQFTAVAILKLVQDGKLTLDEPLRDAWVDCPGLWCGITIRQLLSHTSGITGDLTPLYPQMKTDLSMDQLLSVYANIPLLSPQGAVWRYSNVNYWILGKVIEIESGRSYANFVAQRVLVPGMTRTRYGSHDALIENRAAGYELGSDGVWVNARYFSATLGYSAGGFVSTPRDMVRWYAALARGDIISRDMLAIALTPSKTNDGKPTGYGLGWYVSDIGGEHVAHHGGSTFGFQCYVYWMPSRAIFTGVFENRSDRIGEPSGAAIALLRMVSSRQASR